MPRSRWPVLISSAGGGAVEAAEITPDAEFSHVNRGAAVGGSVEAISAAETPRSSGIKIMNSAICKSQACV